MEYSIHSPESIKYYREVLGADNWVMEMLLHGFKISFKQIPGPYEDVNNRCALKHSKFLWGKILEWESAGFCIRIK